MKLGVFANRDFINAFNELIEKDLPIKTSYKLSKIHKTLAEENQKYVELKEKALLKYCETDNKDRPQVDERGNIKIKEDQLKEFENEFTELSNIDFKVGTFSVEELGNINVTPKTLTLLSGLIEEYNEEDSK